MPQVKLIHNWPSDEFRRTVQVGKEKPVQLTFHKDRFTEVTPEQWQALQATTGKALHIGDKPPRDPQSAGDPNDEVTRELAAAGLKLKEDLAKQKAICEKLSKANEAYAKANEELQAALDAAEQKIETLEKQAAANARKPKPAKS